MAVTDAPFRTPDGREVPAVTAAEMRAVDRVAVETFGIDLLQMMENAGRTLATRTSRATDGPVTVVAGSGGNGGGGLACARHLSNHGRAVQVVLDRDPEALEGAAAHQYATLAAMEVPVGVGADAVPTDPGPVVDALVGYGLDGPLHGEAAEIVTVVNSCDSLTLALDMPSGRNATTGAAPGPVIEADATLTLALPKTGLGICGGELTLVDISVPAGVYEKLDIQYPRPFSDGYTVALSRPDN